MEIYYQYDSVYFPAAYADNHLLYSVCDPKQSHAFNSAGFKHNNYVGLAVSHPNFAISPNEYTHKVKNSKSSWEGKAHAKPP